MFSVFLSSSVFSFLVILFLFNYLFIYLFISLSQGSVSKRIFICTCVYVYVCVIFLNHSVVLFYSSILLLWYVGYDDFISMSNVFVYCFNNNYLFACLVACLYEGECIWWISLFKFSSMFCLLFFISVLFKSFLFCICIFYILYFW